MALVRMGGSNDGSRLTVATMLGQPTFIPERTLRLLEDQFLIDGLLRQGPPASNGAVAYRENQPLFADSDPEIVAEFGEIPVLSTSRGALVTAHTVKRGAALMVSREMRSRNNVSELNVRMDQMRNTFLRAYDKLFNAAVLGNAGIQTFAATAVWATALSTNDVIRKDIAKGMGLIEDATPVGAQSDSFLGFEADTLVISTALATNFLNNDAVNAVFAGGDIASESLKYTGKLPRRFFGLDVVRSRTLNGLNKAVLMQRGVAGFISDEYPMEATAMYEDKPRQAWRSDFSRASLAALDNPKAVCVITGVES